MGLSQRTILPTPPILGLPEPLEAFASYQRALAMLTPAELHQQLTAVNAALEAEANQRLTSLLQAASTRADSIDSLDQGSPEMEIPWTVPDRSSSQESGAPKTSWQLLSGTSRLGPRLAAKLVLASAKAQSRRR